MTGNAWKYHESVDKLVLMTANVWKWLQVGECFFEIAVNFPENDLKGLIFAKMASK